MNRRDEVAARHKSEIIDIYAHPEDADRQLHEWMSAAMMDLCDTLQAFLNDARAALGIPPEHYNPEPKFGLQHRPEELKWD